MIRPLTAVLILGVAAASAIAQPTPTVPPISRENFPDRPEMLRRIALYESAASRAEGAHASNDSLVKLYANLGALYQYAGFYLKSEDAMRHVIALLRPGPQEQLAVAIGRLAMLHNAMGQAHQAEKEQMEVLKIRQTIGDRVGIAQTELDLADVFLKQNHTKQGLEYAQEAEDVLADNPKVEADSRIAVRETLAYALCGNRQCDKAIPLLLDAIQIAKTNYGPDSLSAGVATYVLGYAYWHNGNPDAAAELMESGTQRMKVDLGWGHVIYQRAMAQYAKFLRERGQIEAAATAEREVRQAAAVVDARSFTTRTQ